MAPKATMRMAEETASATPETPAMDDKKRVKTSDGHTIALRDLSVLEEMRLLKVLGEFNSSYYAFCSQVARVSEIDGSPVPIPNNEREIETIAARIGRPGVAALMQAIAGAVEEDGEKEKEQVKK